MRRALAVATLTLASAPALAAGPDDAKTEAAKPEFTSAAVAGVFKALPPGSSGYPIDILLKMRERLGGDPVPGPEEPKADAP